MMNKVVLSALCCAMAGIVCAAGNIEVIQSDLATAHGKEIVRINNEGKKSIDYLVDSAWLLETNTMERMCEGLINREK